MPKASRDSLNAKGKRDAYMFDPEDLVLVTDEKHPLYDDRVHLPVNENLVLNMLYAPDGVPQGVLEPVTVARNTETGTVEVVIGRQRVKAAREANKRLKKQGLEPIRVPAMIQRVNAHRGMGMIISENEQREDDTPLGRARKAQRYLQLGRDETEVAVLFGISKASVKNMLALLDAPAAVRHAVDAGKISVSDGYKLAREDPETAKKKVAKLIEHAPRTPGKKKNANAGKAREIMGNISKEEKIENELVELIASWLERPEVLKTLTGTTLPKRIRDREWKSTSSQDSDEIDDTVEDESPQPRRRKK